MALQPQTAYDCLGEQVGGFRGVFDDLPIGIILTDKSGKLVMRNREAKRIFGTCAAGSSHPESCWEREIYRQDNKAQYLPNEDPLSRALSGEEVIHELMFVKSRTSAAGLWIRTNSRALRDAAGAICGAMAVFFDVTEFRQAAERMRLLSLAVEQTADSVVITDKNGSIEYVNHAFETTTGYSRQEALGKTPRILKSGRHDSRFYSALWSTILSGEAFRDTLVNRKKTGELYFAEQTITPIRNTEGEMTHFVSVLKDVTELRGQQERTIQLNLAREVQKKLHASATSIPGLQMGAVNLPADETGGDYFDSIPTSDSSLTVAMGDVSGHGFYASLGMALTRAYVRSACDRGLDVESTLTSINRMLCVDLEEGHFVTLVVAHIDLPSMMLTYASAGHVPALLFDASGRVEMLGRTAIPLGLFKDASFTSCIMQIRNGQTLVMLTDGITESGDGLGTERIIDYVRGNLALSSQQIAEGICHTALSLIGNAPQDDDMTALVVKMAG